MSVDDTGRIGRPASARATGGSSEPPDAARFDAEMRAARDERVAPSGDGAGDGGAATREVALDLTQLTLDITGIVDPTPVSDGANGIISLVRGDWQGAAISAVSILPGGDVAKLAKLDRLGETLDGVSDLVRTNPGAAAALRAPVEAAQAVLNRVPVDSLPEAVRDSIRGLKGKVDETLDAMRSPQAPPPQPAVTVSGAADGGSRAASAGSGLPGPISAEGAPPSVATGGGDRPGGPPPTGGGSRPTAGGANEPDRPGGPNGPKGPDEPQEPSRAETSRTGEVAEVEPQTIPLSRSRFGHAFERHGQDATEFLTNRARAMEQPNGQFLDDQAAARFIQENLHRTETGAVSLPVPEGFPARIINPDGSFSPARTIRLVPGGNGVITAFPEP